MPATTPNPTRITATFVCQQNPDAYNPDPP
jgi:hypothetical protein